MEKTNRIKELDALRGIAALMIVLFHFTMYRYEADLGFKLGTTGVDLFFMISGFVIFMSLSKIKNSVSFVINRVSRLYPTYWASVSITFLFILIQALLLNETFGAYNFKQYLGNLTMFQFYLKIPDLDGPYWTMIIEMIFYIGLLFLYHFKLLKHINIIGVSLTILVVLMTNFGFQNPFIRTIVYWIPFFQFVPLFFAGIIFYKIYTIKSNHLVMYSIVLLCLISQILLFKYSGSSMIFINHREYACMLIIFFGLFTLFVNNKLNFIVSKGTLFLGKISFPLYLTHQFISIGLIIPYLTLNLGLNYWMATIITLPIVIALAALITYYIEIPMSRIMKEKLSKKFNSQNLNK